MFDSSFIDCFTCNTFIRHSLFCMRMITQNITGQNIYVKKKIHFCATVRVFLLFGRRGSAASFRFGFVLVFDGLAHTPHMTNDMTPPSVTIHFAFLLHPFAPLHMLSSRYTTLLGEIPAYIVPYDSRNESNSFSSFTPSLRFDIGSEKVTEVSIEQLE